MTNQYPMHGLVATAPMSGSNWYPGAGLNVHRTGAATVDHFDERSKSLQAIRVLHKYGSMDWETLRMLFAEPCNNVVGTGGQRRPIHRPDVAHPVLDAEIARLG